MITPVNTIKNFENTMTDLTSVHNKITQQNNNSKNHNKKGRKSTKSFNNNKSIKDESQNKKTIKNNKRYSNSNTNNNNNSSITTLRAKDPQAKGHVVYDVPLAFIAETVGLQDALCQKNHNNNCIINNINNNNNNGIYLENATVSSVDGSSQSGACSSHQTCGRNAKNNRNYCICRLHLQRKCGQGSKCKSLHVSPGFVEKMRKEKNVQIDQTFLTEVIVKFPEEGSLPFAIRYTATQKTAGLEAFKNNSKTDKSQFAVLCPHYNPRDEIEQLKIAFTEAHYPGSNKTSTNNSMSQLQTIDDLPPRSCPHGSNCKHIHCQPSELKNFIENKQQTPCCASHGDIKSEHPPFRIQAKSGKMIEVSSEHTALTKFLKSKMAKHKSLLLSKNNSNIESIKAAERNLFTISLDNVCDVHLKSRCKFGRCCQKLHVCRDLYNKLFEDEHEQEQESIEAQEQLYESCQKKGGKTGKLAQNARNRGCAVLPLTMNNLKAGINSKSPSVCANEEDGDEDYVPDCDSSSSSSPPPLLDESPFLTDDEVSNFSIEPISTTIDDPLIFPTSFDTKDNLFSPLSQASPYAQSELNAILHNVRWAVARVQ